MQHQKRRQKKNINQKRMQHIKWPIAHKRLFGWCTFLENVKRIRVMCIDISHWKFYVHCVWCSQAVGCSVHLLNENPHVHSRVKLNVCKFVDVSDKRTCTASVVSVHNGAHTHFGWKYNMCWKSRRSYVCIFLCAVHTFEFYTYVFRSLHFFGSTSCLEFFMNFVSKFLLCSHVGSCNVSDIRSTEHDRMRKWKLKTSLWYFNSI